MVTLSSSLTSVPGLPRSTIRTTCLTESGTRSLLKGILASRIHTCMHAHTLLLTLKCSKTWFADVEIKSIIPDLAKDQQFCQTLRLLKSVEKIKKCKTQKWKTKQTNENNSGHLVLSCAEHCRTFSKAI